MNQDKELKLMLTDMLAWFHNFCVDNGLTYYVASGTMLGAVRHQGFIPWDDDIDVAMPRKDYERLAELMICVKGRYVFEDYRNNAKDYFYNIGKIYDTKTTLVEDLKVKVKRGIYIDIFPLDGAGNNLEEAKDLSEKMNQLDNLLMLKIAAIRKGRKFYKNLGVVFFRIIPINTKKLLHKFIEKAQEKDYENSLWVGDFSGGWGNKAAISKEVYGKPQIYKFENIEVYGVEKYDEYLTHFYGKWEKLPPEDKRVTHHTYCECDLHKSYLSN